MHGELEIPKFYFVDPPYLKMIWGPKKLLFKKLKKKKMVSEKSGSKEDGPKTFCSTKIMTPCKLGPKSLVKIGPVTAEILLIWTNFARVYVAWTNVIMTVDIF